MSSNPTAGMFQNPAMLGMLQNRLDSLVGQSSGYVESLPPAVQKRLRALSNIQDKQIDIEKEFQKEVLELEKKYLALYQPLFDKRATIVKGEYEPTEEESTRQEEEEEEEKPKIHEIKEDDPNLKGIPEFWLTIFKNHPVLADKVTEEDEPALATLTDIKLTHLDGNPGFRLEFFFSPNDYFTNASLVKTYYLTNAGGENEMLYERAEGTAIEWKEGKNLSVKVEIKKQRHKGTNKTRTVKRTVPNETFFAFYAPPAQPNPEEEHDDEALDELEAQLEADYDLGELIKEKLIPRAVDWFTGKALEYEDLGEDYDDMYDEEDEDEDDDEDDEEEGAEPKQDGAQPTAQQPAPECKQQ